jgi:hypothetical protein
MKEGSGLVLNLSIFHLISHFLQYDHIPYRLRKTLPLVTGMGVRAPFSLTREGAPLV